MKWICIDLSHKRHRRNKVTQSWQERKRNSEKRQKRRKMTEDQTKERRKSKEETAVRKAMNSAKQNGIMTSKTDVTNQQSSKKKLWQKKEWENAIRHRYVEIRKQLMVKEGVEQLTSQSKTDSRRKLRAADCICRSRGNQQNASRKLAWIKEK